MGSSLLMAGLAFATTWTVLFHMLRTGAANVALDRPNERSLHAAPIPRTGGVAILAGLVVAWMAGGGSVPLALMVPVAFLAGVSFLDDLRGLSAGWRFGAHFLAAAVFLAAGMPVPGWAVGAVFAVGLVWLVNLYNFMDGSDGLAGGMALFGFGAYGAAALLAGESALAGVAFSIAAAAVGFLFYNFHPARVFMGDAGSIPLGFLAGALGLWGWSLGCWPLWFPALVFSPFVVDATVTLGKRALRGEKVWQAHRGHYYQRLVRMGFGHRRTALLEYGLMLAVGLSALWGRERGLESQAMLLAFWAGAYAMILFRVDGMWRRYEQGSGSG